VHAYMHCKEGDDENAAYWYGRASNPVCCESLEAEWLSVVCFAATRQTVERSLFRASLTRTINDLQIHVRPLSTCKVVHDMSNADWKCGLENCS
jgi:hypothetical protein